MDIGALLASVIASVGVVGSGYLVARRFQKLGGGEAQERLNKIRAELDAAQAEKIAGLEAQFLGCKTRLVEVEKTVETMAAQAVTAASKWARERTHLNQEIHNLREDVRRLSPDRRGAKDRTDD